MKRFEKAKFFIVAGLIALVAFTAFIGVRTQYGDLTTTWIKGGNDIRWGIDIRGGVDVTFSPPEGVDATKEQMEMAESTIKLRLLGQNITDSEVYTDYDKDRVIVRFPWKSDEVDFNPEAAITELGETALLTFREGLSYDEAGNPLPTGPVVMEGKDVLRAQAGVNPETGGYIVQLELNDEGTRLFADATSRLAPTGGQISIWMDETLISAPGVRNAITDGNAMIDGMEDAEAAKDLAEKINAGALPFKLITENFNTISPTLGLGAKDAMLLAGVIAFGVVMLIMIVRYRLPGLVAIIALAGQVALSIAAITGYLPAVPSFTLTLPGIAGIILAIGFGVDANIITAERIKEELLSGKTLDGSIDAGFKRAFTAIFDGNATVIIVAVILMGAFGPPTSFFAKILSPLFTWFGPATAGSIYSFGYTLMVGVILNMLMGVFASRVMLRSLSKFGGLRNPALYGGANRD